jgi:ribosomal protein S18 acetylase RimI-like enzyme
MEWTRPGFRISDEPDDLDIGAVHEFLRGSYWAREIPRDVVERSIQNSLCLGVYEEEGGRMVGFGRAITDYATYAYLSDIYVDPAWRGRGLSKWLVEILLGHPELKHLRRWMLVTQDAQDLYRRFGFRETDHPDWVMEIVRPGLYERWAREGRRS